MSYENKIKELNLELPDARDPVGSYVASKQIGKCYLSQDKFLPQQMEN